MTRLQQARARHAKQRAAQDELQRALDAVIPRLPVQPSQAFLAIIEYGIEGLAAHNPFSTQTHVDHLVESLRVKRGFR